MKAGGHPKNGQCGQYWQCGQYGTYGQSGQSTLSMKRAIQGRATSSRIARYCQSLPRRPEDLIPVFPRSSSPRRAWPVLGPVLPVIARNTRFPRFFSFFAILLVLASSGCVLEQTRDLLGISGTFYPAYNDVARINFTTAKASMSAGGWTVKVYPAEWNPAGAAYDNGAEISRKGDFVFHIASWTYGGSQKALASGFYNASKGNFKTEKDVGAAEKYVKAEVSAIAAQLNLTVDWPQVKWAVDLGPAK
jgi:hypothetical protein